MTLVGDVAREEIVKKMETSLIGFDDNTNQEFLHKQGAMVFSNIFNIFMTHIYPLTYLFMEMFEGKNKG